MAFGGLADEPAQRLSFLKQHIELGISTVDHADIYGNYSCEALFGEALALEPSIREQIEIVTKCDIKLCSEQFPSRKINHYDTGKAHIVESVNNSLSRLQVENIDVLLIHRPDVLMDADEVAEAFAELKQQGKVNHFGVSNFSSSQFDLLQSRLEAPLVTNQVEINPLNFEVAHDGTPRSAAVETNQTDGVVLPCWRRHFFGSVRATGTSS